MVTQATPLDEVWVDFNYGGTETGSESQPFDTLAEALAAVAEGGTVKFKPGRKMREAMDKLDAEASGSGGSKPGGEIEVKNKSGEPAGQSRD